MPVVIPNKHFARQENDSAARNYFFVAAVNHINE